MSREDRHNRMLQPSRSLMIGELRELREKRRWANTRELREHIDTLIHYFESRVRKNGGGR